MRHSCRICLVAEEALPERCPAYDTDTETDGLEAYVNADAPTNIALQETKPV